jgi:DMSO reductase anchor subunit
VLASLGLLASALHMGYPLNALNALRHVSSSWLSREIIFASLYLAALGLATLLMFAKSQAGSCFWRRRALSGWWMCSAWRRSTCMRPW